MVIINIVTTGLFRHDFVLVSHLHKSVQCTFAVLHGQPGVRAVVFLPQVFLQLQGSTYSRKERRISPFYHLTTVQPGKGSSNQSFISLITKETSVCACSNYSQGSRVFVLFTEQTNLSGRN